MDKPNEVDAAPVHRVVMRRLIPRCYDCKRILWPWQQRGIDWQSHRECHRDRIAKLRQELAKGGNVEVLAWLDDEARQIEDSYA